MIDISARSRRILDAIVEDYINTAEPVSSKAIATRYAFGLSPATIRNIMAELENDGYLVQPHTSAGRVPTEKSFRAYLEGLDLFKEPGEADKVLLRRVCGKDLSAESVFTDAARALSRITNCAGVMFAPRSFAFTIRQVNLVPIDSACVMVVLVSILGLVETRLVRLPFAMERGSIEKMSNYLNSIAEGLNIRELRDRIVEEMKKEKNLYDALLAKALSLGSLAFDAQGAAEEEGVVVEGRANILDYPEFRDDFERMRKLFAAFEEKGLLLKILDKGVDADGIQIYFGSETPVKEFSGLSFVTAPYGRGADVLGTIGVVGPVRMNYSKIIPLVKYASGLLSRSITP